MDASLRSRAEQLASKVTGQATTIENLIGLMRLMMKSTRERMFDTEMDVHLGRGEVPALGAANAAAAPSEAAAALPVNSTRRPNRRAGRSRKTVQGDQGELTISTPRDYVGTSSR